MRFLFCLDLSFHEGAEIFFWNFDFWNLTRHRRHLVLHVDARISVLGNLNRLEIIPTRSAKNRLMLHYMTVPRDFVQPDWDLTEAASHLSSHLDLCCRRQGVHVLLYIFSIWLVSQ